MSISFNRSRLAECTVNADAPSRFCVIKADDRRILRRKKNAENQNRIGVNANSARSYLLSHRSRFCFARSRLFNYLLMSLFYLGIYFSGDLCLYAPIVTNEAFATIAELQNETIYCYARRLGLWASGGAFFAPISTEKKCGDLASARGAERGTAQGARERKSEAIGAGERGESANRLRASETNAGVRSALASLVASPPCLSPRRNGRRIARVCVAPPAISLNLSPRHLLV